MAQLARNHPNDPVDVIIGDWMSEYNMTTRAANKSATGTATGGEAQYEPTFLEALEPAIEDIAKHGIKVAVNAGASDTKLLHRVVTELVRGKGLGLKVAYISGDEVLPAIERAQKGVGVSLRIFAQERSSRTGNLSRYPRKLTWEVWESPLRSRLGRILLFAAG